MESQKKEYYTIYDWMREGLGLANLLAVSVFALIWSWTVQEKTYFVSRKATAARFFTSDRTIDKVYTQLLEAGLIIRREEVAPHGGNIVVHYAVAPGIVEKYAPDRVDNLRATYAKFTEEGAKILRGGAKILRRGAKEFQGGCENSSQGGAKILRTSNNNRYNALSEDSANKDSNGPASAGPTASAEAPALTPSIESPSPIEERSSSPALEPTLFHEVEVLEPEVVTPVEPSPAKDLEPAAGGKKKKSSATKRKSAEPEVDFFDRIAITFDDVPEDLAAAFVNLRPRSAKNTERAWKDVVFGVSKARALGFTAQQFFHFMVYHGWYGCNAGYVFERLQKAQPEELQDMTVDEAVAAFQKSQPAARPAGGYSRPAPAAKPSKFEQNTQSMLDAIEILNNRV